MTTPEQDCYREMCRLRKEVDRLQAWQGDAWLQIAELSRADAEAERLREVVNSNSSLLKIYSIAQERDEAVAEVKRLRALAAQHLT